MSRTPSDCSFNFQECKREETYKNVCEFLGRLQHYQFEQKELIEVLKDKDECEDERKDLERMIEARKALIQQVNQLAKVISPKVSLSVKEANLLNWVAENNVQDIPKEYFTICGTKEENDATSTGGLSVPNVPPTLPSLPEAEQRRSKSLFEYVTDCLCCRCRFERYR